jgi:hypothetical protein
VLCQKISDFKHSFVKVLMSPTQSRMSSMKTLMEWKIQAVSLNCVVVSNFPIFSKCISHIQIQEGLIVVLIVVWLGFIHLPKSLQDRSRGHYVGTEICIIERIPWKLTFHSMIINYAKENKNNQFWLVEYLINWSYIEHLKLAAFPMHRVGGRI